VSSQAEGPSVLAWENHVVVQAVQALLGLLSEEVMAVSAEISVASVVLHFYAYRVTGELREDAEEACFELDVLLDGKVDVSAQCHEGLSQAWPGLGRRPIYLRKEESSAR
jgi:hypothetical protein